MKVQIILNGSPVSGLLQASIASTNCFSADSYSLTFAIGGSPSNDSLFWSSISSAYIEINVTATPEHTTQNIISGMVDSISLDPIQGIVAIEGRDLSSSMIDGYRQQDFVNQTASEVVSTIAQCYGLNPVVTATSGNVGRYYGDGYTRLSLGQFSRLRSDWDLIVQLARENSFDVFVQGTYLFFQPQMITGSMPVHLSLHDVKTMRFERALTVASNVTARVQSWNSQGMVSYDSNSALNNPDVNQVNINNIAPIFLFPTSNLTSQQVTDSAQRYAAELGRLGTVLHAEMPWNLGLLPRTTILIDETNSAFDSIYQIDSIERHYNTTSGSSQHLRATLV